MSSSAMHYSQTDQQTNTPSYKLASLRQKMLKWYREQRMDKHICMDGKTDTLRINNYAVWSLTGNIFSLQFFLLRIYSLQFCSYNMVSLIQRRAPIEIRIIIILGCYPRTELFVHIRHWASLDWQKSQDWTAAVAEPVAAEVIPAIVIFINRT